MKVCRNINFGVEDVAKRIRNVFCLGKIPSEQAAESLCAKVELAIKHNTLGKITWVSAQGIAYADESNTESYIMDIIELEIARQVKAIAFGEGGTGNEETN